MELKVSAKKVKEAAETSPEAKKALKKLFPEVFKPELFRFGSDEATRKFTIDTYIDNGPLFIADALAPRGMDFQCLGVSKEWEMSTFQHRGYTMISFTEKDN
jgi:hypothetical protein